MADRVKFTNVLVAPSHLAMAGLVTSLHLALLLNLGPGRAPHATSFWLWQGRCVLRIGALTAWFRLAGGVFSAWAVATGRLTPAWSSVPVTDLLLAAAQAWLLWRGIFPGAH